MKRFMLSIAMLAMLCGVANADLTTGLVAHYDFEAGTPTDGGTPLATPASSGDGSAVVDQTGNGRDLIFVDTNAGTNNIDAVADILPNGTPAGNVFHGQGAAGPSGFARGNDVLATIPADLTWAAFIKLRPEDAGGITNLPGGQEFFNIEGARMTISVEGPGGGGVVRGTAFAYTRLITNNPNPGDEGTSWNPQAKDDSGKIVFADDVWHHIAVTYSDNPDFGVAGHDPARPKGGLLSIFVDGEFEGSIQKDPALVGLSSGGYSIISDGSISDIHIGGRDDNRAAAGYVDDARLYNRQLSDADILQLATGVPEPTSLAIAAIGLVGWAGLRRRRRS